MLVRSLAGLNTDTDSSQTQEAQEYLGFLHGQISHWNSNSDGPACDPLTGILKGHCWIWKGQQEKIYDILRIDFTTKVANKQANQLHRASVFCSILTLKGHCCLSQSRAALRLSSHWHKWTKTCSIWKKLWASHRVRVYLMCTKVCK